MTPDKAYLSTDEIRPLAERSDLMGAWLVLHCWGVIAASVALFGFCPSSHKMGHQSGLSIGGSGSFV